MKSFIDQIKLLSYGELDYFIVDSNLKVLDCVVENAAILSGSFNPIHYGHRKLLDYCSKKYDKNKYYEISLLNVDKPEIVSDDLSARLKKFSEDEKIIKPAVKYLKGLKYKISGPHSSDTMFLKNNREKAVIATKISPPNLIPEKVEEACDRSLKRLSTDYIDLYQIHWPNHSADIEKSMIQLQSLLKKGKIRSIGVCNFGVKDLDEILKFGDLTTNQLPYNLLWRPIEQEILPECSKNDIGLICYSPLAQGLLTGRYKNADDVPDGISRSRLFNNKRPLSNHSDEGCEEEVFLCIEKIKKIAKDLGETTPLLS